MNIKIVRAKSHQAPIVQKLFESSPEYFKRTENSSVLPHFAEREMADRPPIEKRSPTYEKVFCMIYLEDEPIGVVDLHKNHPIESVTYIGLLLLSDSYKNSGIGRAAYFAIEEYVRSFLNSYKIKLGVSQDNDVETFWKKMDFSRNGHSYTWRNEGHSNECFEMEKSII